MEKYPRLTVRLNLTRLEQLRVLARVKNCSRAQIVRNAIDHYYRAHSTMHQHSVDE